MDWEKLKAEYLQGGISYRQLSQKYNVPLRTIATHAKDGNWAEERQRISNAVATDVNSIIERGIAAGAAKCKLEVYDVAAELLELTKSSMMALSHEGPLMPQAIGQYAAALRAIRTAMERPSEMDIEEQRARIEKLRRETQTDNSQTITVQLEGDLERYGG